MIRPVRTALKSPSFISPMPPSHSPMRRRQWIHQVKHDGYRTLLLVEGGRARPSPATATIGRLSIRSSSRRLKSSSVAPPSSMAR